jgi:hypothetical protein
MAGGELTRVVLGYEVAMRAIVNAAVESGSASVDWSPLEEFVAVDEFERVGTWMEVSDWAQYTAFLTQWARASAGFQTTVRRIGQLPALVYLEVEERHTRPGGTVDVVNSMSVYEFTDDNKIRRLAVYLQQPR